MHYLVNMRELLKAYLKVSLFSLMKAVFNATHLELMIETLNESSSDIYLD